MEFDFVPPVIQNGRIAFLLNGPSASWTNSSTIAKIINDAEGVGEALAVARSASLVEVVIPANEREDPASFISRVQRLPVTLLPNEARIIINQATGTIVMTGDVEISPVVISHKGLTISTTTPPPIPTARNPVITEKQALQLDTTKQGGAKLQELVDAMDMIRVPPADRVIIFKELHKTGKLHAQLILE
jgi:flagellar P-ring protein precursor FlgI